MRLLLASLLLICTVMLQAQEQYLFVGTYTTGESKGIYVYRFNNETGEAMLAGNTDSCTNPSYLALAPGGNYLYAVNETGRGNPGRVSAFAFDKNSGKLSFLNQQLSGGDDPCFITTDPSGKYIVAGNYSGGSVAVFPVKADGGIEEHKVLRQHTGSGIDPKRQTKPHVHSTFFTPDGNYVLVPDLGTDKIVIYRFRNGSTIMEAGEPTSIDITPGGGPRHLAFHPNGKFAYLIEEMGGAVDVFAYANGHLQPLQRIATHPADFTGQPGSADIHVSPDGKFLYASNRGEENNIAIFSIDANGKLAPKGYQSTLGTGPRSFTITSSGRFLLVANQRTNNIVVFRRNLATGLLTPLPTQINVPNPVCVKLLADGK